MKHVWLHLFPDAFATKLRVAVGVRVSSAIRSGLESTRFITPVSGG